MEPSNIPDEEGIGDAPFRQKRDNAKMCTKCKTCNLKDSVLIIFLPHRKSEAGFQIQWAFRTKVIGHHLCKNSIKCIHLFVYVCC